MGCRPRLTVTDSWLGGIAHENNGDGTLHADIMALLWMMVAELAEVPSRGTRLPPPYGDGRARQRSASNRDARAR